MRTFGDTLEKQDQFIKDLLHEWLTTSAPIRHSIFKDLYILELDRNQVKKDSVLKYGITQRHFSSFESEIQQEVSSWEETQKYQIELITERVKQIKKEVKDFEKDLTKQQKIEERRRLGLKITNKEDRKTHDIGSERSKVQKLRTHISQRNQKIKRLEKEIKKYKENITPVPVFDETGKPVLDINGKQVTKKPKPKICFGGRKLLAQSERPYIKKRKVTTPKLDRKDKINDEKRRKDCLKQWKANRNRQVLMVGSKSELCGNQNAQFDRLTNTLKIRIPDYLIPKNNGNKFIYLKNIKFEYGRSLLEHNLKEIEMNGIDTFPISYVIQRNKGKLEIKMMMDEKPAVLVGFFKNGAISYDTNFDHIEAIHTRPDGSAGERRKFPFPDASKSKEEAEYIIGKTAKDMRKWALELGCGIIGEDLDFTKKKAYLKKYNKEMAKKLNGFAYVKFKEFMIAGCKRDGINFKQIKPHYTSVIGKYRYSRVLAMNSHMSAAYVIGRLGLGFTERFSSKIHVTPQCHEMNKAQTDRGRWKTIPKQTQDLINKYLREFGDINNKLKDMYGNYNGYKANVVAMQRALEAVNLPRTTASLAFIPDTDNTSQLPTLLVSNSNITTNNIQNLNE